MKTRKTLTPLLLEKEAENHAQKLNAMQSESMERLGGGPRKSIPQPTEAELKRFHAHYEKTDSCWNWIGDNADYGRFGMRGKIYRAHRLAWTWFCWAIPPRLVVHHKCNNTRCVNPTHLSVTTNRENILFGTSFVAQCARTGFCPKGHAYNPENTYMNKLGHRFCRECGRQKCRRQYHAKKAAWLSWKASGK